MSSTPDGGGAAVPEGPLVLIGDARFRPFRNAWMLEEVGEPYIHECCMPRSRGAAAHPMLKIPVLRHGPLTMYESAAINTYLGDRFRSAMEAKGVAPLVPPPGTASRATYEQLCYFLMTEVDAQALWIHRKHEALGQYFGSVPDAVAHARSHFAASLRVAVSELSGAYLLSSGFSPADILLVHCCDWAQSIGWLAAGGGGDGAGDGAEPLDPALAAYLDRCRSRPAYRRTLSMKKGKH